MLRIAADLGSSGSLDYRCDGEAWIAEWCRRLDADLAKLEAFEAYLRGARRDRDEQ